jgi:hypothetical protein
MMAVEVIPVAGTTFRGSEPEPLFSWAPYAPNDFDTTEDGRFVLIRRRGAERSGELIVVENWFEELKARVGR